MWESFKRVWPLFICQSLSFACVTQMVFSASLVGKRLVAEEWATLPLALLPVGTALGILPVTRLMSRFGRKSILIASIILMVTANFLAGYGAGIDSFVLFCFCTFIIGLSVAALSQLRFVAMEQVPQELQAGAVSSILLGGILAAFIGPELSLWARLFTNAEFEGSYYVMGITAACAIPFLLSLPNKTVAMEHSETGRSTWQLLKQHSFITAVSAAAVGYGVMSFVMTATPISMHDHFNHSLADTKWVIQSHIMAMFLPSLISAWLIKNIGLLNMMAAGLFIFLLCIITAFVDQSLMNFWFALIMLGIGWNFLFVGATVMLPQSHTQAERFTAQGFNDSIVFSVQAIVSLSAGAVLGWLGWQWLLLICVPLILWQALLVSYSKTQISKTVTVQ